LEAGGNGIAKNGTHFAKPMQVAATDNEEMAYRLGLVCGREGRAVGCNWTFAPIVDIDLNFNNPITNVRTFGSDPERVARMAKAYTRGIQESGMAVSVKHFPGDGVDDRDQHLLTSINSMSTEEWDAAFGLVYKELIEAGADTIMIGHIMLPSYSRKLVPSIADEELMPATLAPELVTGLLRQQLGFNGMIVTDSTGMAGFTMAEKREIAVPKSIAAGCDMFLFNKNIQEDYDFMMKGLETGIVTLARVEEAVTRILALKASLGLHQQQREGTLVPEANALSILQCAEHEQWAKQCADLSVTLVKDTQKLLPLSIEKHRRLLFFVQGDEGRRHTKPNVHKQMVERLLEEGFEVTLFDKNNYNFGEVFGSISEMKQRYDVALYFANIETASNQTNLRINWAPPMGIDMPWFTPELPTLFISVANPYHLQDVPRIPTYINAYTGNDYIIDAVVDKLVGKSEFKGINPVDPFCQYWEARL
jgi:beta-N-acetylhexosaminidase